MGVHVQIGDIVKLCDAGFPLARGLVVVPEGHLPWSENWDIGTTFAKWEVGLVVDSAYNPGGSLCIKLFTSHGSGWIEACELMKL